MCRIFGISYGDQPEKLSAGQIARIMGNALTGGGPHAFGWVQNVGGELTVRKFPGRFDDQNEKLFSIKRECNWLIGHTRFATHGDSSNLNNVHPIRHHNIIGVHNGVLSNHEAVLARCGGRFQPNTQVDSEAIFAAVEHFGHKEGLAQVYGSMVAVYTDVRAPESIFIARSNNRALRLGWTKRGNLIFASEQYALDLLAKAGIEFEKFSGINENRVLRIMDGDIVERATYRKPSSSFPARQRLIDDLRVDQMLEAELDQIQGWGVQRTASKRGEILFPTKRNSDPKEREARLNAWGRSPLSGSTKEAQPAKSEKGKKRDERRRKNLAHEVGVPVGENKVKYKGRIMDLDDYLTMRAVELSDAIVVATPAPATTEDDWE